MKDVNLAPLTARLKGEARWNDEYPAWQVYADECERLLEFLRDQKATQRFWPRLCSKKQQRDEALNEIRVAHYLDSIGYPILAWEPIDAPPRNVEFSVSLGSGKAVFVEVKSPGWESELTQEERKSGRTQQNKYVGIEGRAASPIRVISRAVQKAQPKFTGNAPSLIFISDDCFVSIGDWGSGPLQIALTRSSIGWGNGLFLDPHYANVGGVCLFWISRVTDRNGIQWSSLCLANPNASPTAALPQELIARLCTPPIEPMRSTILHSSRAIRGG